MIRGTPIRIMRDFHRGHGSPIEDQRDSHKGYVQYMRIPYSSSGTPTNVMGFPSVNFSMCSYYQNGMV